MKKISAHGYTLLLSFILSYLFLLLLLVAAGLTLHFIFWIPLAVPPLEVLGILARGGVVASAILTILYARSTDYREEVTERLRG